MDSNNNNGRGIFYGVIGVATLVVAIIGATFAYFSASITRNGIANVKATTLRLEIPDEKSNFKQDLIPIDTHSTGRSAMFARYISLTGDDGHADRKAKACKDDVNNSICSVYQFTVKNPSETTAQTVVGSLKISANTFQNLHYAVFKGADVNIPTASYDVQGTAGPTVQGGVTGAAQRDSAVGTLVVANTLLLSPTATSAQAEEGAGLGGVYNWPNTLETLNPGESTTYTVVMWLEETGSDQTDFDAGMSFAAGITFTSNTGAGVTGVISAGGATSSQQSG